MTKFQKRAILRAAVAGLGFSASTAEATFVYDLRIVSGPGIVAPTKQAPANPGTFSINLYGRVSGTDGNTDNDGLGNGFLSLVSSETDGGAVASGGGVAAFALNSSWAGALSTPGGPAADVNADGILDLGTPASNTTPTNQAPPRQLWRTTDPDPSGRAFLSTPGVTGSALDAQTAEFLLGTYTINVTPDAGAVATSVTHFNPLVPTRLALGTQAVTATRDGVTFNVAATGTTTPGVSAATPAGSGVTFTRAIVNSNWLNSAGGDWGTPSNWSSGVVPGSGTNVSFNLSSTYAVALTAAAAANELSVNAGNVTFNLAGNTLTTSGAMFVDGPAGTTASIVGGTFTPNDNITITGGTLNRSSGTFTMATSKTMTVQSGGQANFTGTATFSNNAIVNVVGAGSSLNQATSGALAVRGGSQLNVTAGASSTARGLLLATTAGTGTLLVSGSGSNLTVGPASFAMASGGTASATFENNATASLAQLVVTMGTFSTDQASVTIQSGAVVTASGDVFIGANAINGQTSIMTVTGGGSTFTQSGFTGLILGSTANSSATLNVNDAALFTTGTGGTNVDASGTMNLNGGKLVAHGRVHVRPGGELLISNSGKLDLTDEKLIVAGGDLGLWNGSRYTGVTGLIQSGRGNGTWNGDGIVTSMSDATTGVLTTLAVALAEDVGYAGGTFGGVSVAAGDVLVMYTWGGDAELDGDLDGDDYFWIDSNVGNSGSVFGFDKGDFDYDGDIDGDDYFIIDSNIAFAQSQPNFPTGAGASIAPVPEPGTLTTVVVALTWLRRRAGSRKPVFSVADENALIRTIGV